MINLLLFFIGAVYILLNSNSIYGGDAGDLVSAIITKGYAHPPGYPLYTLVGGIFKSLPLFHFSIAGKVVLISSFATLGSLFVLYLLIRELVEKKYFNPYIVYVSLTVLAFNYIVFLYSVIPEVFPLNTLFVLLIFYFSIRFYKTARFRYLYIMSFFIGLGISHHHTFVLILPSVLFLFLRRFSTLGINKVRNSLVAILFLGIGLFPLMQLIVASKTYSPIQWGVTDTLKGFVSLLTREGYGTFSAGPFVTKLPQHRLLQLKNLALFVANDFTILGLIAFFVGIFVSLQKKLFVKTDFAIALGIAVFLFGPFFSFYANFPLRDSFFFATLERFFHAFYFFFTIYLYLGLFFLVRFIHLFLLTRLIHSNILRRLFYPAFMIILLIYPFGVFAQNILLIKALKNDVTAENIGYDVFNNAEKKSIIILSQDTVLFNTQYIYYSNPELKKDFVLIHGNKLYSDYSYPILRKQFPDLVLNPSRNVGLRIPEFIAQNMSRYHIYANEKYPLPNLPNYRWTTNGFIYKLERKEEVNVSQTVITIEKFWKSSRNNNLIDLVKQKNPKYKNFFTSDALRIYSTSHQNTAFYFLENGYYDKAIEHIKASEALDPNDQDYLYLYSLYYQKLGQCSQAEESAFKALRSSTDKLYFNQLKDIAERCYTKKEDKDRLFDRLSKFTDKRIDTFF